ncbi:MAG: 50S ribosomal protein L25 [Armatimonadota bacterium]|nr:50S ribosomal protein L25 [Armatimonadota bacterium]MDR7484977.1 50S ribosomal protein L25 [Armatimonadota bacterium]MDR7533680.1 50S ribosomal protein L25 [Armatimonadota bacterium]MDR7535491.1 50S ribosomal protein L25 [Armatimonadota bacterium]
MERVALKAQARAGVGKGVARALRRQGMVPGVLYGHGRAPRPLAVDARALNAVLRTHAGLNVLIDLEVAGNGEPATVMVKEVQRDLFRHEPIHVDFCAVSLSATLQAHVPIVLKGVPKGVAEGGVVEHHLREALVECLPTQIPDSLEVDISALGVGRSLHASDLTPPEGVRLLTPPEEVVVTVVAPRVHEEAPAAAPEAAPAAPGVPAAPGAAPTEKTPGPGR